MRPTNTVDGAAGGPTGTGAGAGTGGFDMIGRGGAINTHTNRHHPEVMKLALYGRCTQHMVAGPNVPGRGGCGYGRGAYIPCGG